MKAKLPDGYNFFQSFSRTYKQVKNPIGTMQESMARFNGTYSVNLGRMRLIATQHPGFIDHVLKVNHRNYHKSKILTHQLGRFLGQGLLTSNGDYWLKQRRLIQPGFHHEKIHALFQIMHDTVTDFLERMPVGEKVNVYPLMNTLAFDMVINTLFDVEVDPEKRNQLSRFISETQEFVIRDVRQPYKSWWFQLSGEVAKYLRKSEEARGIIRMLINQRKESNQKFNDLLDMLLDSRYEDTGLPMDEKQVIDEILILLIAGHETTANALSFALYLLAEHQSEQEHLRVSTKGLQLSEIVKNQDLSAVINETMRLFPPAWISDRVALEDDQYESFLIPKGTVIALFYYGLHRNPQYWQDAAAFKPARFRVSAKERQKTFFPFGAGPRLCIGNSFAMAEMSVFLQAAVQHFKFTTAGVAPGILPLVTLRPDRVLLNIECLP